MQKAVFHYGKTRLTYYIHGSQPQVLLQSGVHGDEFEVITSLEKTLNKYLTKLPDFLYIPRSSPSAVKLKTRRNQDGVDLNRSFYDDIEAEEARANIELVKKYKFNICFSFHEDPQLKEFYLYDTGLLNNTVLLNQLMSEINKLGINLFTGIDDNEDVTLGFKIEDGYLHSPVTISTTTSGFFTSWLIKNRLVKHALVFEIPGKVNQKLKDKLVDLLIKKLLIDLKLN